MTPLEILVTPRDSPVISGFSDSNSSSAELADPILAEFISAIFRILLF